MKKQHLNLFLLYILILLFNTALPIYAQSTTSTLSIEILISKAEEMLKADPSKAIYYSNAAIVEAQKMNNKGYLAVAMATLGEAYMNQGDFDMGFETITEAVENCPQDSALVMANVYLRLSGCYMKFKDFDQAFKYVDMAAKIYELANDQTHLAACYNSRGLVYIMILDNEKAEQNFKAALEINRRLGEKRNIAANLNNLCLYEGNVEEKIALLNEAISINESLGASWSLSENFNNLGTQYYYGKDYKKALEALQKAMEYARKINAKELICDNYRYSSWVYEAQKNYPAAYQNLLNLYNTEQELLAKDEMRRIELNIIQKRLQAKEQEMIVREQAFQIENLRMQRYLSFLVVGAILLIFLYIGFHYRQRKRIQILETAKRVEEQEKELIELKLKQTEAETLVIEQELEYNRQELTNFAFFIRSRNEMLSNIQQMVKEGYKLPESKIETHLRHISAYITQFNAKSTESELLIDQINAKFIDKLSKLHPDLSKNEQRLASLLRIGLSTKEISSIIDSTPKTVNMARYRLRKKMNLETDESLSEYMKCI